MKKFDFKTRLQWGWFKAALFGVVVAVLAAPAAGRIFGREDTISQNNSSKDNPVSALFSGFSFGGKVKVMINGDVVALARSKEAGEEAFKAARLAYNADGVQILDVDVTYQDVDKEKDADVIKGMRVLSGDKLSDSILKSFDNYAEAEKELAYIMRIDDYTVTVDNIEDLISILENAQSKYDEEDSFQVKLNPPASRNTTMYEVGVTEKTAEEASGEETNDDSEDAVSEETAEKVTTQAATEQKSEGQEETTEAAAAGETDGVKYVGFADTIQVVETYVSKEQITDKDAAYNEITQKSDEAGIYVVEPGDCLSIIAEKNNMTVDELKELNPGIESDDNLYYDDRLNITVPKAVVQILVEKQETYQENYYEDVVYEDDDSMYIGETEVVQEGSEGTHTVTDLVTYKDDIECGREQLEETVEVAAVAQVVKRGTKSKPTYMYPVTNWVVTSTFGTRWGRMHEGIDVGVPIGTTVRASRAGCVVTAGWVGGYGNCVIIDHGDGVCTRYGHLSQITTSVGQYVDQGEQIALSGNTGRSTGPHLHFEIRINNEAVDPAPYLEGLK